jgi:hypothetical protein
MTAAYRDILRRVRLAFPQPVSARVHDSYAVSRSIRVLLLLLFQDRGRDAKADAGGRTMSAQITVTLPDDVVKRAEILAQRSGRPVAELLAETIELSLRPLGTATDAERPITDWSDEEVLAAAGLQMSPRDDRRLSELLQAQQGGKLGTAETAELGGLMQVYQEGLLHKARALREAVQRGLRAGLEP